MKNYEIGKDYIKVFDKISFNPTHILECGQVFSYKKEGDKYYVFPQDKFAIVSEQKDFYLIETKTPEFFVEYFDLNRDYSKIKRELAHFEILRKPIEYGYGIRILKQDLFEMLISFIVSQNNNIKRIQLILGRLREKLGVKTENGYAFPSYQKLLSVDTDFFASIGAGYRASYLFKVLRQVSPDELVSWQSLSTQELRKKLIALVGVGPKVADCILLFGFGRGDVFPVDTWIHQMYNRFYSTLENREKIRDNLVNEFGSLSGYAQQYLFYYQRSGL